MERKKGKNTGKGNKPAGKKREKAAAKKRTRSSRIDQLKGLAKAGAAGIAAGAGQKFGADVYEHVRILAHEHGPMVAQVLSDGVHQVLRNPTMTLDEYERYLKHKRRRDAKPKTPSKERHGQRKKG